MATSHTPPSAASNDSQVWENLKQAIAQSSGFHQWQLDCDANFRRERVNLQGLSLDMRVHQYLRETLETLAY